jgi:hypothetical protein
MPRNLSTLRFHVGRLKPPLSRLYFSLPVKLRSTRPLVRRAASSLASRVGIYAASSNAVNAGLRLDGGRSDMELACLVSTVGPNGIPVWIGGPTGGGALSGGSGGGALVSGGGGGGAGVPVSVGGARESTGGGWASDESTVDPPSHAPTASANATENLRLSPFMLSTASEPAGVDAISCMSLGCPWRNAQKAGRRRGIQGFWLRLDGLMGLSQLLSRQSLTDLKQISKDRPVTPSATEPILIEVGSGQTRVGEIGEARQRHDRGSDP